jgi:hypothetical protein
MRVISTAQYAAEMRRVKRMRDEAIRYQDRSAQMEIRLMVRQINRTFCGRDLPRVA